jgi:uncharacterized protein (TIGR02996 family)
MAEHTPDAIARLEGQLRADPNDTDTWRVYADHLLDRGDRRGELVHLRDAVVHEPELAKRLEALERELQPGPRHFAGTWRYGFLIELSFVLAVSRDLRELAAILVDPSEPLIGSLQLRCDATLPPKFFAQLAGEPLTRLVGIQIESSRWMGSAFERGDALVGVLADAPTLALRRLRLAESALGDKGLLALSKAPLTDLRSLDLRNNPFSSAGLATLLASPVVATLEHLDLRNLELDERAIDALAGSPQLGKLRTLRMSRPPGLARLLESTTLSAEVLDHWRGVARRSRG